MMEVGDDGDDEEPADAFALQMHLPSLAITYAITLKILENRPV